MPDNILLVEPTYYTSYPPIGLLKLSKYHKNIGDNTKLVRGCKPILDETPHKIYITSLFMSTPVQKSPEPPE